MPSILSRLYWTAYTAANMIGQARYPFRRAERIRRDGDRRARRMVRYAYRWAPYYRETLDRLGLTPRDFRTVADLSKLPLISVADLQAGPERFRSRQFTDDKLLETRSSGSTGRPHSVWHDLRVVFANIGHGEREACIHRKIIGKGRKMRAMIPRNASHSYTWRDVVRANAIYPKRNNMWRGSAHKRPLTTDPPEVIIAGINARQPDLFYAYGSLATTVFSHAHEHDLPIHRPVIVRYAADAMPEAGRRLITEEYGVPVFSAYQSIEMLKTGFECEAHRGYHINADLYPVRIIDEKGADCPPGVEGEIVTSNLVTRGTVLLNYRMGDRATLLTEPCPCGRNLPMISFLQGRMVDQLYDTAGRRFSWSLVTAHLKVVPGVYQYQLDQLALDHVVVKLVVSGETDRPAATEELVGKLKGVFGQGMRIEVQYLDEIVRTAAGKLRYVRNLVDEEAAQQERDLVPRKMKKEQ